MMAVPFDRRKSIHRFQVGSLLIHSFLTIRDQIDALYRSESRRVLASLVHLLNDFDLADDAMHETLQPP
jgi:hypothetical protein